MNFRQCVAVLFQREETYRHILALGIHSQERRQFARVMNVLLRGVFDAEPVWQRA